MFTSKFQAVLVALALISSSSAFAQRGGINGPVVTGALNPSSGATSLSVKKLNDAQSDCYSKMIQEMLLPFITETTNPTVNNYSEAQNSLADVNSVRSVVSYKLSNSSGPLANQALAQSYTDLGGVISISSGAISYASFEIRASGGPNSAPLGDTLAPLSPTGLPLVSFTASEAPNYNPITHVRNGQTVSASNLSRAWIGAAPSNPAQVTVMNTDSPQTPTNFRINGERFFQCVESQL